MKEGQLRGLVQGPTTPCHLGGSSLRALAAAMAVLALSAACVFCQPSTAWADDSSPIADADETTAVDATPEALADGESDLASEATDVAAGISAQVPEGEPDVAQDAENGLGQGDGTDVSAVQPVVSESDDVDAARDCENAAETGIPAGEALEQDGLTGSNSQGDTADDGAGEVVPEASDAGDELLEEQVASAGEAERAATVPVPVPAPAAPAAAQTTAPKKAPAATEPSTTPAVTYRVHSANKGWLAWGSGSIIGVKGSQIEALQLKLEGVDGTISYRALVQGNGWTDAKKNGAMAGTTGKSLCLQAIRAMLSGSVATGYDLYYRSYVVGLGWLSWAKNNELSGTSGFNRPIDRVQFRLVKKGGSAPASKGAATKATYITPPKVSVQTHVQNIGWQNPVGNNKVAGTSGKALRMEAMKISITKDGISGGARYSGHVQNIGWQNPVGDGKLAGTSGKALRIEALDLELTGEMAKCYDVFYRVHVQNYGWMGWAEAAELAGSSGRALRVEAIQVYATLKGGTAPTKSSKLSFVNSTNIMGPSDKNASQLARWYRSYNGSSSYPASTLKNGGAATIEDYAKIVVQEAEKEGVRAEIVFAQAMFETGNLRYGGLVKANQYNYCGLKNANGSAFQSFSSVRQGVRAHVQHLKAYASTRPLNNACVDPRFGLISRGCAPNLDNLSGRWSGESDYGARVNDYLKRIEAYH